MALFILGIFAGGITSFFLMCCLQINRIAQYEEQIQRLSEQQRK